MRLKTSPRVRRKRRSHAWIVMIFLPWAYPFFFTFYVSAGAINLVVREEGRIHRRPKLLRRAGGPRPVHFSVRPLLSPILNITYYISAVLHIHCNVLTSTGIENCIMCRGSVYLGCSDVTESIVTIRSPFCGYNTT